MEEQDQEKTAERRRKQSMLAVQIGLAANILLAVLKATFGVIGNSPALLADGINSTSDVAYGIVVSIFVRLSGKPADQEHPYGHDQLESVAAVVVGAFVITTAIAIFWNSVDSVWELLTSTEPAHGASLVRITSYNVCYTKLLRHHCSHALQLVMSIRVFSVRRFAGKADKDADHDAVGRNNFV